MPATHLQLSGSLTSDLSVFSPKIKQPMPPAKPRASSPRLNPSSHAVRWQSERGCAAEFSAQRRQAPSAAIAGRSSLAPERVSGYGSALLAMCRRASISATTAKSCRSFRFIAKHRPAKSPTLLLRAGIGRSQRHGSEFAGTDLKLTQFFATGAAARNLAKNPVIQNYFSRTAVTAVDPTKVAAVQTVLKNDQSAIDAYFQANSAQPFATVRDKLLKDPELASIAGAMPSTLTTAGTAAAFDAVLSTDATFVPRMPQLRMSQSNRQHGAVTERCRACPTISPHASRRTRRP